MLDLDPYGGPGPLGMFPLCLKITAYVIAPVLVLCFCGLLVCLVSRLAGDRPMSPQFRKVHRPHLLIMTDRFPLHQYCLRCLSACCRLVLDDLWKALVYLQPDSFPIGKVWVPGSECTFVRIPYSSKCIGELARSWDCAD